MKRFSFLFSFIMLISSLFIFAACKESNLKPETGMYSINYLIEGEVFYTSESLGNEILELPANPVRQGYDFAGWFVDQECLMPFSGDEYKNVKLTNDVVVYGKMVPNRFKISFVTNSEAVKDDVYINYNDKLDISKINLSKDGYRAVWYLDSALTKEIHEDIVVTSNITLYAKWEIEEYTITYVLSRAENSEKNVGTYTIETEDIFIYSPTVPLLTRFEGWFTEPDGKGERVISIPKGSTGNITLYAHIVNESK